MNWGSTALVALAVAAAWGAEYPQFSAASEPVAVAGELLGGEVRLSFDDDVPFRPTVSLTLNHRPHDRLGTTFTVGFHLANVRFARSVSAADLEWVRLAPGRPARRSSDGGHRTRQTSTSSATATRIRFFTVSLEPLHGLRDVHFAEGRWQGDQRGLDFHLT